MGLFRRLGRLGRPDASDVPTDWPEIVERHVAVWRYLDDHDREALGERLTDVLISKQWEAARGFVLTDRMRVVIAAQAALLVLGLDTSWLRGVSTIVVHPSTRRVERTSPGPVPGTETCGQVHLLGEAAYEGPVVVAWDSASRAARHPGRGVDVVIHELTHKIDMLDHVVDGTPPLDDPVLHDRWVEVCTREFELLVAEDDAGVDDGVLDPYGATDAGEFFAVATEAFFTAPIELSTEKPELYRVLHDFYGQDPAARLARGPRPR